MNPVKVGIVGCAHACKDLHRPWLSPHPEFWDIRGLFDLNRELAESEAEAYGGNARAEDSLDSLLARDDIEVVFVLTKPPTTHHAVAMKVIEAGKDCWIEKPFAQTTAECDEILAAAKEKGVKLFVYQNRRWDKNYQQAQKIISSGDVSDPKLVQITFSSAGGACSNLDWGVHIMDQALRFGKGALTQVYGWCAHPENDLDGTGYATVDLRFAEPPAVRVQFVPWDKEEFDVQKLARFFVIGEKEHGLVPSGEDWPDQETMYRHLFAWMREDGPRPIDPIGARNAIYTFELMLESAKKGVSVTPDNWADEDDAPFVV